MRGIAQFTVHGRIGSDPEYTSLANGTNRVRISVCANLPRLVDGKWEYQAVWFNFAWFGDRADNIVSKLKKGLPIVVTGEITNYNRDVNGTNVQMHNFRPMTASIIDEEARIQGRAQGSRGFQQQPTNRRPPAQQSQQQPRPQPQPQPQPQAQARPTPQPQPAPQPREGADPTAAAPVPASQELEYPDPDDFGGAFSEDADFGGVSDDDIPF